MSEVKNFEGNCSKCGRHGNIFALKEDDDGYCDNCLEEAEEQDQLILKRILQIIIHCLSCPTAKTLACRARNPGSTPGWGVLIFLKLYKT